jgi:hypothetical protein
MKLPASWMPRLANFLMRHSEPYDEIADYMERRWVFRLGRWGKNAKYGYVAGRLNRILRSDSDRALHDHPWPYVTLILRGGYYEVTEKPWYSMTTGECFPETKVQWYGPGSILFRGTKHKHRLVLPTGQTALTLFITLPFKQQWGFFVNGVKVYWRDYLKDNKQ